MASLDSADPAQIALRRRARLKTVVSLATFGWLPILKRVQRAGEGRIHAVAHAPEAPVAVVLGAKVREHRLSAMLADRLDVAVRLLQAKKVSRLFITGTPEEVAVMTAALAERDVPGNLQLLDPRGRHTFESIANARRAGLDRVLIVSQRFHLPRALYLARAMGIEAHGIPADLRAYESITRLERREVVSSVLAYWMAR